MRDVAIVGGPGEVTVDQFRRAIAVLDETRPRLTELAVGAVRLGEMLVELAVPQTPRPPPWVAVPAPLVREGLAVEKRRALKRARKAMRRRRGGDRAGRPL